MKTIFRTLFLLIILFSTIDCISKNNKTSKSSITHIQENIDCQDEFVETKGIYNFTELGLVCYEGDLEAVKKMINNNACKERCLSDDIFEYDILYTAILYEHTNIVEYLISINENVNIVYNENGYTALSLACSIKDKKKALDISKILLKAGAQVNGAGDMGGDYIIYPIFRAIETDNIDLVQLLIDHAVNLNVIDKQGNSVIDIAKNNKEIESLVSKYLLKTN
ncbi:MAG: ankyrin repeat domain-containing protein [Flavobacteriaceae bacterium]|jgi:ankyrin repeat protein|nr:ankyrin repeat domain-containing protein [Flavobacteriaceae bacterium]